MAKKKKQKGKAEEEKKPKTNGNGDELSDTTAESFLKEIGKSYGKMGSGGNYGIEEDNKLPEPLRSDVKRICDAAGHLYHEVKKCDSEVLVQFAIVVKEKGGKLTDETTVRRIAENYASEKNTPDPVAYMAMLEHFDKLAEHMGTLKRKLTEKLIQELLGGMLGGILGDIE